jgi:hypothetical protein
MLFLGAGRAQLLYVQLHVPAQTRNACMLRTIKLNYLSSACIVESRWYSICSDGRQPKHRSDPSSNGLNAERLRCYSDVLS